MNGVGQLTGKTCMALKMRECRFNGITAQIFIARIRLPVASGDFEEKK
jgi:hypothetical protein